MPALSCSQLFTSAVPSDTRAEVDVQCAKLCRRIGDEVAHPTCYMMARLIGDLMKVRQKRVMQHQLQAFDPRGGGVVCDRTCRTRLLNFGSKVML